MNMSKEEEEQLLDRLSREKAVELLPVSAYVFVMMVVGLCGNVFVCVFYSTKGRVTPTSRLIVAVAVIDSFICVLMPKNIVDQSLSYKFTSRLLCKANVFVNHSLAIASGMVLVAIAVFRFRAICRPFSRQLTIFHANISIVLAFVFAIFFSIPVFFAQESIPINITVTSNLTVVGYDCNSSKKPSLKPLNLAVNVLHFFIFITASVTFFVLYSQMGAKIVLHYQSRVSLSGKPVRSRSTCDNSSKLEPNNGCSADHDRLEITSTTEAKFGQVLEDFTEIKLCQPALRPLEAANTAANHNKHLAHGSDTNYTNEGRHTFITIANDCKQSGDTYQDLHVNDFNEKPRKISAAAVKQTAMLFTITLIFVVSFLPYLTMNFARTLSKNKDDNEDFTNWIQFCTRSYLINSAANPFVYGLFNSEFRHYVKHLLFCCCREN